MKVSAKGQVTIPQDIRERAGLMPETEVEFVFDRGVVKLIKAATTRGRSRGQRLVAALRRSATVKLTTDQIMALTRGDG